MIAAALAFASAHIPAGLRRLLGLLAIAVLLAAATSLWLRRHDHGVIEQHEARVTARTAAIAAPASDAANTAADTLSIRTERTNADARDAALRSDDPLRAGLDRLRVDRARAAGSASR